LIHVISGRNMESVVELKDGAASPRCKAVISQTPLDIAHSFVAETFRFGTDLTVSSASPAVKETVSSPLRVSCSQTEKRKLVVCKLVHNGSKFFCSMFIVFAASFCY